jgi:hypothetical protein
MWVSVFPRLYYHYTTTNSCVRFSHTFWLSTIHNRMGRTNHLLSFHYILSIWHDTDHRENIVSDSSSIVACVSISIGMCLWSHCLATTGVGGIHRQQGHLISILLFFQNKESRLKVHIHIPYYPLLSSHLTLTKFP